MIDWYDPTSISKPDIVYFDTWVYKLLIDNTNYTSKIFNYLKDNILYPAISDIILMELNPKKQYLEKVCYLLSYLNSILIKNSEDIIVQEIKNYPKTITNSIIVPNGYLLADLFSQKIRKKLLSNQFKAEWNKFRINAKKMKSKLDEVMYNYPLGSHGKYEKVQAEEFVKLITIQWLSQNHPEFVKKHIDKNTISDLKLDSFKGLQIYAYYIFYKYYVGKRKPNKISDFGDLFHLFYIPYCKLVVLERDQCSILRDIQKDNKILEKIKIENIEFIKTL